MTIWKYSETSLEVFIITCIIPFTNAHCHYHVSVDRLVHALQDASVEGFNKNQGFVIGEWMSGNQFGQNQKYQLHLRIVSVWLWKIGKLVCWSLYHVDYSELLWHGWNQKITIWRLFSAHYLAVKGLQDMGIMYIFVVIFVVADVSISFHVNWEYW
jgi:hypothetical protein